MAFLVWFPNPLTLAVGESDEAFRTPNEYNEYR